MTSLIKHTRCLAVLCSWTTVLPCVGLQYTDASIALQAQRQRIEMIERVMPTVVCIYDGNRRGGGAGVIIDAQGHGLTNYHVVADMLNTRRGLGGLSDGLTYELQVLGIDPTGDVAMFRLSGKSAFDFAELADSDAIQVGDTAIAMGNPFLLAEKHTPSVSLGIVSGLHRYQWGQGNALVYTDCIQTDAAINPGNSGGPLFDAAGKVMGINGRISASLQTRGKFNVGLGYAISANQIKRFIPALHAGLMIRHGTLQATVGQHLQFDKVLRDGPAYLAGIRPGDLLVSIGGQEITSANQFASTLGVYPEQWPIPISFKRDDATKHAVVRLAPLSVKQTGEFVVIPEINRRAVKRMLDRFLAATNLEPTGMPAAANLSWIGQRSGTDKDGTPHGAGRWEYQFHGGTLFAQLRNDVDSPVLRQLRCADGRAELIEGQARFSVSGSEALLMKAVHALFDRVFKADSSINLAGFSHKGGDESIQRREDGSIKASTYLEVLKLELPGNKVVLFSFDTATDLLCELTIEDRTAGLGVSIQLGDYQAMDSLRLPQDLILRGPGLDGVEKWSHWESRP